VYDKSQEKTNKRQVITNKRQQITNKRQLQEILKTYE
jgi:hypothetical protein